MKKIAKANLFSSLDVRELNPKVEGKARFLKKGKAKLCGRKNTRDKEDFVFFFKKQTIHISSMSERHIHQTSKSVSNLMVRQLRTLTNISHLDHLARLFNERTKDRSLI